MSAHANASTPLLVSGYNENSQDPGVSHFTVSADGKQVELLDQLTGIESPSFCTRAGSQLFLASETNDRGGLASGTIDSSGAPSLASTFTFENAAGTCFVLKHPQENRLYGADYNSGSICSCTFSENGMLLPPATLIQHEGRGLPRSNEDPNADRQSMPHVHTLSFIPQTTLIAAVDLGLDLIAIYETDGTGRIINATDGPTLNLWPDQLSLTPSAEEEHLFYRPPTPEVETLYYESPDTRRKENSFFCLERSIVDDPTNNPEKTSHAQNEAGDESANAIARLPIRPAAIVEAPPLSGPRIIAYHPSGRFAALICELGCELIIFELEAGGLIWNPLQRIDLLQWAYQAPANGAPPLAAHVEFSADGRFLYTSVRGTDQLIAFEVDNNCTPKVISVCSSEGGTPRHFALDPSQTLLAVANQTGNNVALFERDPQTGTLEATTAIPYPTPSCIVWE